MNRDQVDESYDRLRDYTNDLVRRMMEQDEWHARNPEYPNYWDIPSDLLEHDPYPYTNDTVSARTFADMLVLILDVWELTRG